MPKYIDADEYIKYCEENWIVLNVDAVNKQPEADVEPVSHGRWIERDLDNFRKYECACSECGARYIGNYDQYCEPAEFSYCPKCGAKMYKEEDHENRT